MTAMPNNDYILRSDALNAACSDCYCCATIDEFEDTTCPVKQRFMSIPAADVEPKRYAEWISPDGISVCSEYGKAAPYDVEGDMIMYWPNQNFCPNCGCRMNVEGRGV